MHQIILKIEIVFVDVKCLVDKYALFPTRLLRCGDFNSVLTASDRVYEKLAE